MSDKLKNMILHAYQTVPYYKELFDKNRIDPAYIVQKENLEILPILKKETIIEEQERFISKEYCIEELFVENTSGSTGIPLKVYKSKKDRVMQGHILWKYRNKLFGVDTKSHYCTWHVKGTNIFKKDNRLEFSAIMLDDENLELYAKELYIHKPSWLFGGAETWCMLADFMSRRGYKPPNTIKFIESTGEFLRKDVAMELESFFGCPVVNMYGCIEMYGIARADKDSRLRILNENVMVEILDDTGNKVKDGEFGQIVLTSLNNMAMPFIRYSIGDIGRIVKNIGDKSQYLELKSARINEKISIKNAKAIDACVFHFVVERLNRNKNIKIKQFKVIQKDYDDFIFYINLDSKSNITPEVFKEKLRFELSFYNLDEVRLTVEFVNRISINNMTGKYQYFINEIIV